MSSTLIGVLEAGVVVDREANSCRGRKEKEMRKFMPGEGIFGQTVSHFVSNSVFKEVRAYLLHVSWMRMNLPKSEEQPGPPFSQSVIGTSGSVLEDSTKT